MSGPIELPMAPFALVTRGLAVSADLGMSRPVTLNGVRLLRRSRDREA
ncbi:hypothetical protein [Conexibacter arvalis]|uniref:Uncharacterized protein n=1 Tax=Conexibacter arvalis TaxID=912552 RepID=A0A840ICI1_9ACTN|nr:hypothetical protein [Conexibacter arvalis]MBB4661794.1 hypothetical protein [Conexibacter arvalis]